MANGLDCKFNIPTDSNYVNRKINHPTAVDAQIHFTIWHAQLYDNHWNRPYSVSKLYYKYQLTGDWKCYKGWNTQSNPNNCPSETKYYWNYSLHTWECIKFRVFRCGDWLVNSMTWTTYDNGTYAEQCDPNDPNRVWWNNNWKTCNPNTCQLEFMPAQCSTDYNTGHYTFNYAWQWLTSSTPNLCSGWSSTNFWTDPNPIPQSPTSPITYHWSCNNGWVITDGCQGVQMWCGDGEWEPQYWEECEPWLPVVISWLWEWWDSSPQGGDLEIMEHTILSLNHLNISAPTSQSASTLTSPSNLSVYAQNIQEEIMSTQTATWYSCNSSCQIVLTPQCSSQYNGTGLYTSNSSQAIFSWTSNLCSGWTVTWFNASQTTWWRSYSWGCATWWITTTWCNAYQNWCGDWIVNWNEACDPNDTTIMSWWWGGWCSNTCEPIESASCNSQLSGYYSFNYTNLLNWLNSQNLCAVWTATNIQAVPQIQRNMTPTFPIQYTWSCENGTSSENCSLNQNWCWDGQINGKEICDDWALNGQIGHCSNTCDKILSPLCISPYNWDVIYTDDSNPILNSWMDLCSGWTVTNFQVSGTTSLQFTWDCETTWLVSNWDGRISNSSEITVTTTCNFEQQWCWDGQLQENYEEECDPELPSSIQSWYTCDDSCKLVEIPAPQCSSQYTGWWYYTSYYTGNWLLETTPGLCSGWTVTGFWTDPSPIPTNPTSPIAYHWSCTTWWVTTTWCNTNQQWCGDGVRNGWEPCDFNDESHSWWWDGCSSSCKPIFNVPVCSSEYNLSEYYSLSYTWAWLNSWMTTLCEHWTVIDFQPTIITNPESPIQYTWSCTSTWWNATWCNAIQMWCGDWEINGEEECDPNDSTHSWWNDNWKICNTSCQLEDLCNSEFTGWHCTSECRRWLTSAPRRWHSSIWCLRRW